MRRVRIYTGRFIAPFTKYYIGESEKSYFCIGDSENCFVYDKKKVKIDFLDSQEEENNKFGNSELVELTEKVEKLEGEMTAVLDTLNRVVGNPDTPQPTFTRDEAKQAFINYAGNPSTVAIGYFLSELDKIKG